MLEDKYFRIKEESRIPSSGCENVWRADPILNGVVGEISLIERQDFEQRLEASLQNSQQECSRLRDKV